MTEEEARKLCLILEDKCGSRIKGFVDRLNQDFPELHWVDYQYSPWIIFSLKKREIQ